ncbi:uncharacterized protein K460DRAFT_326501 [Cucurbitaria berberidis CBS 394.84]|uniref:DUF7918 domain-containing protein n=1 Tax=Cucurbitaria berberidis CBS 394.84 TaxID=1168544 RepID=A0A9P4LD50_9PLEO|nr:uncharacterized protein K460DRAFT_326501 [Cucurbitaria berberidis CBS 394.84]KAF1850027.1 hypothetical protein K460DRAFT_326501 [Cucurbitaria berberidis CBS 394.84]
MAVLDDVPGLKAEVIVDGRPLREYDDDEETSSKAVTKYVEAQSGAEFAIRSVFSAPFPLQYGVEMKVSVDGDIYRRTYKCPDELYREGGHNQKGISYQEDGNWVRRYYRFTALSIVEEVEDASEISGLQRDLTTKGNITLKYRYITNMHPADRMPRTAKHGLSALGAIPEKAMKGDARSHQATLSEPRAAGRVTQKFTYDVVDDEPFATVHFKYRSLAALKALRIINDEGVDAIPPEERPEDELSPAELREALRRREAASVSIKQEGEVNRQTKREHGTELQDDDEVTVIETRSRKRPRVDQEVIVLD